MPSKSRFKALIWMILPVLKESFLRNCPSLLSYNCKKPIPGFSLTLPSHLSKFLFRLKKKKITNNVLKTSFSVNKNVFYKNRDKRVKKRKTPSIPSLYILKTLMKLVFHSFTSTTFKLASHAVVQATCRLLRDTNPHQA